MPKSRVRKPKRSGGRRAPTSPGDWGEMEPWIRAMMAADDAEASGDAVGTLDIMEAFATGPDGEFFWRPWRVDYLMQLTLLESLLPGWVVSRWLCAQAHQWLHEGSRGRRERAFDLAVELRGGPANLPGRDEADAYGRVVDRDWIYRQQYLYELGGLESFLKHRASSRLLAQADSVHDWARAPMGGYRLVGSTPDSVTWLDLATDEPHTVLNIGSGCLVLPGEHAIGRLAPIEGGELFETRPLLVSAAVARRVADGPVDWFEILREEPATDQELSGREARYTTLLTDVPTLVWQTTLLEGLQSPDITDERLLARALLDRAAGELSELTGPARGSEGEVDPWSCLGAGLVDPGVVVVMHEVARPADRPTLEALGQLLAEPAASVCRAMAHELAEAA